MREIAYDNFTERGVRGKRQYSTRSLWSYLIRCFRKGEDEYGKEVISARYSRIEVLIDINIYYEGKAYNLQDDLARIFQIEKGEIPRPLAQVRDDYNNFFAENFPKFLA